MICLLLIIGTTLLFVIYLYSSYKLKYWKRKGVLQLCNTNVLFGDFKNGILFRNSPGCHLGELYRQASADAPYVGFYIFHKPCLLLKDPEIIKQVLIRDFDNFSNRHFGGPQQKDSLGMTNLFGVKDSVWRYLRHKITPRFTNRKLKQMFFMMMDTSKPMMLYLKNSVSSNKEPKTMDALDINHKYTADIFANIALGIKTDSFAHPNSEYMKYWMQFFNSLRRMVALITVAFWPTFNKTFFESSIYFDSLIIRKIFWNAIKLREQSGTKRGDMIDEIIELKNGKQDPIFPLVGDNLFFQVGIFFGFESSSTASVFTLMELARNKLHQDRAREDIKKSIKEHGWTLDAFKGMKYLEQCINESLRLHPPVSIVDRNTLQDYNIPNTDVCIEKGTPIYISLYGLHYDSRYFERPEVFDPERFDNNRIVPYAFMPFGDGPRKCIGTPIATMHVKVLISNILSEYEVYQRQDNVYKLDSRFTFSSIANKINIEFRKLN